MFKKRNDFDQYLKNVRGKTYLACAFGMEACKRYYSVKYVRVPDLLLDLQEARDDGRFKDTLKKYTNPTLLILDEWLLMRVTETY